MTHPHPKANDRKVLVIGWDAADWRVINPMLQEEKLPNLKKFMDEGVSGNNSTLDPPLSPMLWTSIATGKRPFNHGIHGFSEPTPDGKGIQPITNTRRSCKAIWNILNQCGKKTNVVAWWPSHPAEPVNGVMVSNWYQQARNLKDAEIDPSIGKPRPENFGWTPDQWTMPSGAVHPESLSRNLQEFRFHPMELLAEHIGPFIPDFQKIDQKKDARLLGLAKILSDTVSVHGAATALMQLEPWDFMAVYYDGIDHFSHAFMKYHRTKQSWISEEDFKMYKDVVEGAYRFHDMMLGALLELAGEDTTVIILSDHGFHPDHLRPEHIPAEPAGPAIEHRPYGVFLMKGPGIRKGETIRGASVLDLCPTVLSLFDLPIGADMDGKPLVNCFESPREIDVVPSWEDIDGDSGMHPADMHMDSVQSAEAIKQLVELGYIEEPDENHAIAVAETIRELNYNLAKSYMDAGRYAEAATLLDDIWSRWPEEHRFGLNAISCHSAMNQIESRKLAINQLMKNMHHHRIEAVKKLRAIRTEAEKYGIRLPKFEEDEDGKFKLITQAPLEADETKEHKEIPKQLQIKLRKLMSLLGPFENTINWLKATQEIKEGKGENALKMLEAASKNSNEHPDFHNQIAKCYLEMNEWENSRNSFQKALDYDPENAYAHLGIAQAASELQQHEEAIDHALYATELVFANPLAHFILGKALSATGDYKTAKAALGVAIAQSPQYTEAHMAMADILETHFDDAQGAASHREAALKQAEEEPITSTPPNLGMIQEEIKERRTNRLQAGGNSEDWSNVPQEDIVTIVSGLPRSGTSMMMQMLDKGGIVPFTDGDREADSDNPKGYYEHSKATRLATDSGWIPEARGKGVKIVAQLLDHLPNNQKYRIVFMDRDLREISRSQKAMLQRMKKSGSKLDDATLMKTLDRQVGMIEQFMHTSMNIQCLFIDYASAIMDPAGTASKLNAFLGNKLDEPAMANAVDPNLRRQHEE